MKKLVLIMLISFMLYSANAQQIKFKVGTDATTGKVIKYTLIEIRFIGSDPVEFIGKYTYHEVANEEANATPANNTEFGLEAIQEKVRNYSTNGKYIDSITKLYVADSVAGAISLRNYFKTKAINTFPQVANADPLNDLIEGLAKEMIAIRKINGEFSN